jgi:hypothetical protein
MTKASTATPRQTKRQRCTEATTPSSRERPRRVAPVVNVTLTIEGSDDEIAERFARMLLELTSNTKHPD